MTQGKSNGDGDGPRSLLHALNVQRTCTMYITTDLDSLRFPTFNRRRALRHWLCTGLLCFCPALLNIQLRHLCVWFVTLFLCYVFLESRRHNFVILCQTNSRKASHGKVTSCFRVAEVRLQDMADYLMHVTKCQLAMIL